MVEKLDLLGSFILNGFLAAFHGFLVTISSAFCAWSIRTWLLPTAISLETPLNFVFDSCPDGGVCSFPTANISLVDSHGNYFLEPGINYRIQLELWLPDSVANRNLGMFLLSRRFFSSSQKLLSSTLRSASVPYRSIIIRLARTLLFLPLLVFWSAEKIHHVPVLFDQSYRDNPYWPSALLSLQLQHKNIELENAALQITANLGFFRNFLFHWPLLANLLLFALSFAIFGSMAMLFWTKKYANFILLCGEKLELKRRMEDFFLVENEDTASGLLESEEEKEISEEDGDYLDCSS